MGEEATRDKEVGDTIIRCRDSGAVKVMGPRCDGKVTVAAVQGIIGIGIEGGAVTVVGTGDIRPEARDRNMWDPVGREDIRVITRRAVTGGESIGIEREVRARRENFDL